MPNNLVTKGYSMALSSKLLAESALIAFPTVFLCTYIYSRWSSKWALSTFTTLTLLGLLWVLKLETHVGGNPVWPVGLLIIGSNGIIAIPLPYASESYPVKIRGRATGWVAMFTKGGSAGANPKHYRSYSTARNNSGDHHGASGHLPYPVHRLRHRDSRLGS